MTPDRAKEIWDTQGSFGKMDYTEDEFVDVCEFWEKMPGWTSFADAILAIASPAMGEIPKSAGTDRDVRRNMLRIAGVLQ